MKKLILPTILMLTVTSCFLFDDDPCEGIDIAPPLQFSVLLVDKDFNYLLDTNDGRYDFDSLKFYILSQDGQMSKAYWFNNYPGDYKIRYHEGPLAFDPFYACFVIEYPNGDKADTLKFIQSSPAVMGDCASNYFCDIIHNNEVVHANVNSRDENLIVIVK